MKISDRLHFFGVLQYFSKNDLFMEHAYQYDCDKIVTCIFSCDLKNTSNFQEIMKYPFEIQLVKIPTYPFFMMIYT